MSLWQVMGRQKDIQYASRAKSHIARQKQIHHLRHIIREIAKHVPAEEPRVRRVVKELASWGCGTTMHVARLIAPKIDGEDHTKDIDFTPAGHPRALAGRLRRHEARCSSARHGTAPSIRSMAS